MSRGSRDSPICIGDSDDDEEEHTVKKEPVRMVLSDDEETPQRSYSSQSKFDNPIELSDSVKVKQETEESSEPPETPTKSPQKPLTLNTKRLKWLSCQIKLNKKSAENNMQPTTSNCTRDAKLCTFKVSKLTVYDLLVLVS